MNDQPSASPQGSPRPSISATAEQAQLAHLQSQMRQMQAHIEQQDQQLRAASQQLGLAQQSAAAQQSLMVAQQSAAVTSSGPRAPELPKIRQPASFSGAMGFVVDDWISEMQQQFAYYGARFQDDAAKVRFAVAYLTGAAMHWWENQPAAGVWHSDWNEFKKCLHGRFRPVHAAMLARQKLGKLRQRAGQSVNQYISVFQTTLTPISDMGDMDQVHQFVNGLLPPIAAKVWEKHPADLIKAIDAAVSVEAMHNFGRAALPPNPSRYVPAGATPNPDAMDLSNIEQDESAPAAPANESLAPVLAMLSAMDARLNALSAAAPSSRPPWRGDRPPNPKGRIPGLTADEIKKLRADIKCSSARRSAT